MKKEINLGLCQGRHSIPNVTRFIFSNEVNPLDVEGLQKEAKEYLFPFFNCSINIYVTGLTVALIAVLNATKELNIENVTLYHYDRDSNSYYPQKVR